VAVAAAAGQFLIFNATPNEHHGCFTTQFSVRIYEVRKLQNQNQRKFKTPVCAKLATASSSDAPMPVVVRRS